MPATIPLPPPLAGLRGLHPGHLPPPGSKGPRHRTAGTAIGGGPPCRGWGATGPESLKGPSQGAGPRMAGVPKGGRCCQRTQGRLEKADGKQASFANAKRRSKMNENGSKTDCPARYLRDIEEKNCKIMQTLFVRLANSGLCSDFIQNHI